MMHKIKMLKSAANITKELLAYKKSNEDLLEKTINQLTNL